MRCPRCGTDNPAGARYCMNCGEPLTPDAVQRSSANFSDDYKPISMWGYFGYELLFSIPIVGLIVLIVFSVGGTRNVNLKNFARSYFCSMIIFLIIVAILIATGAIASISSSWSNV